MRYTYTPYYLLSESSLKALSRLYQGSIKALSRLYQGAALRHAPCFICFSSKQVGLVSGSDSERHVFFFYLRLLALLVISAGLNRRRDTPPSEQQAGGKKRDRRFLRPLWVRIYMYMFFFFRQEDTKKRQALPSSSFDPCG